MHDLSAANADRLFEEAELGRSTTDDGGDANIRALYRFLAPINLVQGARVVKITVKETADTATANRTYTLESVDLKEKIPTQLRGLPHLPMPMASN